MMYLSVDFIFSCLQDFDLIGNFQFFTSLEILSIWLFHRVFLASSSLAICLPYLSRVSKVNVIVVVRQHNETNFIILGVMVEIMGGVHSSNITHPTMPVTMPGCTLLGPGDVCCSYLEMLEVTRAILEGAMVSIQCLNCNSGPSRTIYA